nr:hypothetical protein [Tanacetum cinerariifolium]
KPINHAWMESSSDSDQEINANMVFMAHMEKVLSDSKESSSSKEETIAEVLSDSKESSSSKEETIAEQMSSLKPYVPTVILENIITDLEYEVVSLLDKEK